MAWTLIETRSNKGATSNLSFTWSSTPAQGELLVAFFNGDATGVMASSGWTAGPTILDGNEAECFYKIAGASESTTVSFTHAAANVIICGLRYSADHVYNIGLITSNSGTAAADATTSPAASITVGTTGDLVIAAALNHNVAAGNASSPSWSSGFTNRFTDNQVAGSAGSTNVCDFVGDNQNATAGSLSPSVSWTTNVFERQFIVLSFGDIGPITFVGAGALAVTGTAGASISPALPSGVVADDILILTVMTNQGNTFPSISGWTNAGRDQNNANMSTGWYWRRATGSGDAPGSFTIASGTALGTGNGLYGRVYAYRGCITSGTPYEDDTNLGAGVADNNPDFNTSTASVNNTHAVGFVCADDDNSWSSGMPPSGWSNEGPRVANATGGDCMMDAIGRWVPASGSVAAVTIGTMSGSDFWRSWSLLLLPEVVATGTSLGPSRRDRAMGALLQL